MQYVEYAGKCDNADTKPGRFNPKNVNLDEMAIFVNISRLTLDICANWKNKLDVMSLEDLCNTELQIPPPPPENNPPAPASDTQSL